MGPAAVVTKLMILGLGIDLEETRRIEESIAEFGRKFLERVFTPLEIAFCEGKANASERYAARFSAKEAAFKALQSSWDRGLHWRDFEVEALPGGAPKLHLHGKALEIAAEKGVKAVHLSFSHTKTHVTAIVVLEG
jgi:holo-[acyl-carrier protein] synthase